MKTEACRGWRESLGALALGRLVEGDERAALAAHLEGCPGCRAELAELESVVRAMPLADPERFAESPLPPAALGERIAATVAREERASRRGRRRRFGLALGGAAAALAAVVLAVFVFTGSVGPDPGQRVDFAALPPGIEIHAVLRPRAYGTEIQMYVEGAPSGTLCRVALRGAAGVRASAGSFRYRYGEHDAVLTSALDLARTRAVVIQVGSRAFVARVG